jgi:hypothetical protein
MDPGKILLPGHRKLPKQPPAPAGSPQQHLPQKVPYLSEKNVVYGTQS